MKVLAFGAGGLSHALRAESQNQTIEVYHRACDVRDFRGVVWWIEQERPDFIVNCAGISDRIIGITVGEVVSINLTGAIHVSQAAQAFGTPCLLIGSTAGMQAPDQHPWYGPAKAGVIAHARAAGKGGRQVYCLSPNRMDTPMREADWPGEDPATRLDPAKDVVPVIWDIMAGKYAPGANVVVRKVGTSGRIDIYEEATWTLPSLLD